MGKAAAILEWAVNKMEERYELLKEAGVRDIKSFNALSESELKEVIAPADEVEWAKVPKKLPYMVFVIDELADLMMTNKEVEQSIVRIAQKARAVGIHLILATQRPQATVVTGLIKSNMPCRVGFKVASGTDSRIVLDQKGAELLLGQGDMLVVTPSQTDARRCQGTLVDDKEARAVTKFLKTVAAPSFGKQRRLRRGRRRRRGRNRARRTLRQGRRDHHRVGPRKRVAPPAPTRDRLRPRVALGRPDGPRRHPRRAQGFGRARSHRDHGRMEAHAGTAR
jgi:S-DNA-T family DNA segregation ATPase FtsK/SpoIIIE